MFTGKGEFFFVLFFTGHITGLVELPKVDDNNILTTEAVIRDTVNTLFSALKIKDPKNKPRLREYSTVHNQLVSFTLQDYYNLKEIAKLTRVVKNKTNVDIDNFMTALNELLNEDNATENSEFTLNSREEMIVDYVEDFLEKLVTLQEKYGKEHVDIRLKEDIYKILKKEDSFLFQNTTQESSNNESNAQDTVLEEFWRPEEKVGRRIFHGDRTKIKHFPFMASIQIFNSFHCGGSIIKSDLIITASSCLQLAYNNRFFRENPAFLSVRVGSNFYNGGDNIPVLEVYFHPNYNPKNLRNNLCLLRLLRKLKFRKRSKGVKKIDLDRHDSNLPVNTDGVTVIGWGAQRASNIIQNPWRNALAFSVLDVYPLRECQDVYSKEFVTKKNFCAGFFSKGGGACNRDVGGPGVVNGLLTGVISFGSPVCGSPDAPTVFTKVGYYIDWIEEIMEQNVPVRYMRTTTRKEMLERYVPLLPTTFKVKPYDNRDPPARIQETDNLKVLRNTDLFEEFMKTMFDSKEREQYQDILESAERIITKTTKTTPLLSLKTTTPKITHATQRVTPIMHLMPTALLDIDRYTARPVTTKTDNEQLLVALAGLSIEDAYVKSDDDISKELNKDFQQLLDNFDINKFVESISNNDKKAMDPNLIDLFDDAGSKNKSTIDKESMLTLLYLSDSEKEMLEKNNGDKAATAADQNISFEDLTYRNNNSAVRYHFMPKGGLFKLYKSLQSRNRHV